MQWLRDLNPVTFTEAIRQILIVGMTFGVLQWTPEQLGVVLAASSAVLALFVRSATISVSKLDQRVDERVAQREAGLPGPTGTPMMSAWLILPLVAALGLSASACASAGQHVLVEDSVHDALAQVDDGVRNICSPQAAVVIVGPCGDVRKALLPTLEAGAAFNRCVASPSGTNIVVCIGPLIETGGRLMTELKKLPESDSAKLIESLARALSNAYRAVGGKS